jgi:hypothetical protein
MERLIESRASVINTSSVANRAYGRIDLANLNGQKRYSPVTAYGNAKLAQILFTRELHHRYADRGLASAAFHPGNIATSFSTEAGAASVSSTRPGSDGASSRPRTKAPTRSSGSQTLKPEPTTHPASTSYGVASAEPTARPTTSTRATSGRRRALSFTPDRGGWESAAHVRGADLITRRPLWAGIFRASTQVVGHIRSGAETPSRPRPLRSTCPVASFSTDACGARSRSGHRRAE